MRQMADPALLRQLAASEGTPLYILDLDVVDRQLEQLSGFDVIRYAQKAHGGLPLLQRLAQAGHSIDAVSGPEIERALRAGFEPADIELATDVLDRRTMETAIRHAIRVNAGSMSILDQLGGRGGCNQCTLRINPGFGSGHDRKVMTGGAASKHGIWWQDLPEAYRRASQAGLEVTGLHMHVGSGVDLADHERTIDAMDQFIARAPDTVVRVSTGGGIPIPYHPDDQPFPVDRWKQSWFDARDRWRSDRGGELTLETEPGRFLVAEAGTLLTEVRGSKKTPEFNWLLVDAGFQTLARPLLYGAYHHIVSLGASSEEGFGQVVAGPLCESADLLTQDKNGHPAPRLLPPMQLGEVLAILDVGAYGISMASSYNGFELPAEVVLEGGIARKVRRRPTFDESLATEVEPTRQH